MGLFDWLFGKKSASTGAAPRGAALAMDAVVQIHQKYWTANADELTGLSARDPVSLSWPERLRLHHLLCLKRIADNPESGDSLDLERFNRPPSPDDEKCLQLARRLCAANSPYRPRSAMLWRDTGAVGGDRPPDMQGVLLNPSITHLGSLEVYRVDANEQPSRIDFVGFDDLSGVVFAPPALLRPAKLFFCDGRSELVFAPVLYGLTWMIGNEYDRAGRMTRFVGHLPGEAPGELKGATGIGVGQQDFSLAQNEGASLFGITSVAEIAFPLDMRDPRFDEKARARGIDPDEARRRTS